MLMVHKEEIWNENTDHNKSNLGQTNMMTHRGKNVRECNMKERSSTKSKGIPKQGRGNHTRSKGNEKSRDNGGDGRRCSENGNVSSCYRVEN